MVNPWGMRRGHTRGSDSPVPCAGLRRTDRDAGPVHSDPKPVSSQSGTIHTLY